LNIGNEKQILGKERMGSQFQALRKTQKSCQVSCLRNLNFSHSLSHFMIKLNFLKKIFQVLTSFFFKKEMEEVWRKVRKCLGSNKILKIPNPAGNSQKKFFISKFESKIQIKSGGSVRIWMIPDPILFKFEVFFSRIL